MKRRQQPNYESAALTQLSLWKDQLGFLRKPPGVNALERDVGNRVMLRDGLVLAQFVSRPNGSKSI